MRTQAPASSRENTYAAPLSCSDKSIGTAFTPVALPSSKGAPAISVAPEALNEVPTHDSRRAGSEVSDASSPNDAPESRVISIEYNLCAEPLSTSI